MRTRKLSLVVVPLLLTACSQNNVLQQDVYNNQYDCKQDWDLQLCDEEKPLDANEWMGNSTYIGPQYYSEIRQVRYLNRVLKGSGPRHNGHPVVSTHVKPYAKSKPIRGGFGQTGGTGTGSGGGG